MSENLDLVRSIYADWERGDYGSAEWAHPDIEFAFVEGPEPTTGIGLTAMATAMRAFLSPWEEYRAAVEEFRELDNERVLVLSHSTGGRGKTSGLDLEQMGYNRGANLFHLSGGKVTKLVNYWDRDRALADLGLSE
jgi:ketosteroid isomerase-like protein